MKCKGKKQQAEAGSWEQWVAEVWSKEGSSAGFQVREKDLSQIRPMYKGDTVWDE